MQNQNPYFPATPQPPIFFFFFMTQRLCKILGITILLHCAKKKSLKSVKCRSKKMKEARFTPVPG